MKPVCSLHHMPNIDKHVQQCGKALPFYFYQQICTERFFIDHVLILLIGSFNI